MRTTAKVNYTATGSLQEEALEIDECYMQEPSARRETMGLSVLFAAMYFIQGIAEPTEGLIAQPVRSMLFDWGYQAGQVATFSAMLAIPWSLKPLYGLLSDFVPIFGSRRRSYLLITTVATAVPLLGLFLFPPATGNFSLLLAVLLLPTIGVAFSDVVIDALMVERGQPLGITGRLQSVQWAAMYTATILTGVLGGYLSQHNLQSWGFFICGLTAVPAFLMAWWLVREGQHPPRPQVAWAELKSVMRHRSFLAIVAFLFLWNFNPFSTAVLQFHMTREMGFSEQFYGVTISLQSVAAIVACIVYGMFCQSFSRRALVHLSIGMGVASTLLYWGQSDTQSAVIVALAVGFTYMSATLIQMDLAARLCPPEVAAVVFASLMAATNFSVSLSTGFGGWLYEHFAVWWGEPLAFNALVAVGALFTAACWLLTPWLVEKQVRND